MEMKSKQYNRIAIMWSWGRLTEIQELRFSFENQQKLWTTHIISF